MKVKDLERTVNVAWSPADQYPIYMAAGTAAQQLDASFSTNASLEIYSLNLSEPGMDMELKASVNSDHRFHKIVWGTYGSDPVNSVIVGGCDNGLVQMYSASKLLKNEESMISCQDKHSGPVHALDFNPFQQNLLATGASESEIFIWDLNNTTTPMTPGSKSQPLEDVQCISWNRQVQHILATTFHSRCVVWDLRKNEPIIKLTDTASHIRWKVVAWHPEVATQLCLASEEDQFPVVQMWDLRFATSPLKVLENHTRGILSIAWCMQDPDLLISCGKDNRILCWNPNSNAPRGEVLSEIAQTIQWNFDVAWCPRNPALIAASNFDGHVSIYSLMGGKQEQLQTSNKIADSFPGMDGYVQAPAPQQAPSVSVDLSKPPKWLKRPVGASFGFGGKLISFENNKPSPTQNQQPGQAPAPVVRSVDIHQVITEPDLVSKSNELEQALQSGNFIEYCDQKAATSKNKHDAMVWNFIKANFAQNRKEELLNLLGYKPEEVNMNLSNHIKKSVVNEVSQLSDQLSNLNNSENYDGTFDAIASENKIISYELKKPTQPFKIGTGNDIDGLIAKALLLGNIEAAVELCISSKRMADALIIAMTGSDELLAKTQYKYLNQSEGYVSQLISSLVSENWSSIIDNCDITSWKEALAAALTHTSVDEQLLLCERLGERLEQENLGNLNLLQDAQLCYICAGSFNKLVANWSADVSTSSPEKLQELVELVTFMQKAIEQQGRPVEVSGNLANLMSHYASLLASQGNLNTAVNYIGTSKDLQLLELRDRLYYSLGHKPQTNAKPQSQLNSKLSNPRVSIPNYQTQPSQFSPAINPYNPNQFNNQFNNVVPPMTNPGAGQFNTGLPKQNATVPSWQNQNSVQQNQPPPLTQPQIPFTPTSSVPPTHPPRPTSSSSAHSGSGLGGRVKYVVDPSLQSNAFGMRSSFDNSMPAPAMPNSMAPPTPANIPPIPMMPVNNTQVPTMLPGGPQNGPYQLSNCPPILPPNPLQNPGPQSPNFPTPNQFNTNAIQNQPMGNNQMPGMFNPGNMEVAQPALNPLAPPLATIMAPPGWNDPPMLSKSTRTQPKPVYTPQAPITHPLFVPGQTQEPVAPMNNGYTDMQTVPPYGQAPAMQAQQPSVYTSPSVQQVQQQDSPVRSNVATPELSKSKGPVPEEHMYLQTVFDELKNQCSCAANNPQTKRKLDDVSRKLEALYDMLRENKLSPSTTASLHQIVQMVQRGDYASGLNLHTQLVSGPDFALIASFMPGLKVLMQCALQLNVYLR